MNKHTPYKLFANCLLVEGAARSAICDLQRNRVYPIPGILHQILSDARLTTIDAVEAHYGSGHTAVIKEYFEFLLEEELIFFTQTPEWFLPLSMEWHTPSPVTNAVLDIAVPCAYDFETTLRQLLHLDCRKIELRCYQAISPTQLSTFLDALENTVCNSVGVVCGFHPDVGVQAWQQVCDRYPRITQLVLHSAPQEGECTSLRFLTPIHFITKEITDASCCGVVHQGHFNAYIETAAEAHHHNSCLNRKIGIDTRGNIKNCPSMRASFGNVGDTLLADVVEATGFKKYWDITKDQIAVCKDCEFRYVCTDCRAYLENPEDPYSKPLKCGYNPYTCEWEQWAENPLKKEAIDFYRRETS